MSGLFRKKSRTARDFTRVLFATDVHGSTDCFRKFLNAGTQYDCDCIVLGGDITGKMVIPIIEHNDGTWEATFVGNNYKMKDKKAVAQLEEQISRSGSYPYMTDEETVRTTQESGERERKIEEIAVGLIIERIREWVRLAEDRLGDSNIKVFVQPGNDDPFAIDETLKASNVIRVHEGTVVRIDDHHEMIGIGYANRTPWNCPRDIEEDELRVRIDDVVAQLNDVANSIFSIHVPPVDSLLDTCYKLDESVYPPRVALDNRGQPVEFGAGSVAVREAIEKHQPLVGLHGHIHESRGRVKIGRTEAFNPGSEYGEGILRGLILNLTEDRVMGYQFTSG